MSRRMKMVLAICFFCAVSASAQEKGNLLFSDDFRTRLNFAENWIPDQPQNKKYSTGDGMFLVENQMETQLRRELPDNFIAEFRAVFDGKDHGRAGFIVDEKAFAIESSGFAVNAFRGEITPNFTYGDPVTLTLIRRYSGNFAVYTLLSNEKQLIRQVAQIPVSLRNRQANRKKAEDLQTQGEPGLETELNDILAEDIAKEERSPLRILAKNVKILDFRLYAVKKQGDSPNMMANSSFEHVDADGIPPCFPQTASSYDMVSRAIPFERYLENLRKVDTTEKVHGKQSLRLTLEDGMTGQFLYFHAAETVPGSLVLSLYMKASENDFPVAINYPGASAKRKDILVGTEWKRYVVKIPDLAKKTSGQSFGLSFTKKKGTLWLDAVQLEYGTTATEYRPSERDTFLFPEKKQTVRPADITVPKLPAGVSPSEDLDKWTAHAVMTDRFSSPALSGKVWLACDEAALYVGIRSDAPGASVFADTERNGKFRIFSKESSDPETRCLSRWNEAQKKYDAFLKIPFFTLAGVRLRNEWLFNVGLSGKQASDVASLASDGYFKSVDGAPVLRFPADLLRAYRWTVYGETASLNDASALRLRLENRSGASVKGTLELVESGEKIPGDFKPGVNVLTLPRKKAEENITVRLLDESGKPFLQSHVPLEKRPYLNALGRLSYYMNEPFAAYRIDTLAPDAGTLTGKLEIAGKTAECKAADSFRMEIPLADVADGTYEGRVTLSGGDGQIRTSVPVTLTKRPFRENATQINHFSRSLTVEGKPYFPFSPFRAIYNGDKARIINPPAQLEGYADFFREYGFRTLDLLTWGLDEDNSGISAVLRRAEKNGMKIMMWQSFLGENGELSPERIQSEINATKSPGIISMRILDEPEITPLKSEDAEKHLISMRKYFPYYPSYMNNTFLVLGNHYANLNTEILMVDDYLTNSFNWRTVKSVIDVIDGLRRLGDSKGLPVFFFLVGNNIPNHPREPSYGEQIAQSYGAVASGCTGLTYFYGLPAAPGHWKAYVQLNREILSLTDVICSEEDAVPVFPDANPDFLLCRTIRHQEFLYVIACNIDANPAGSVNFTLPAEYPVDGSAEVLFENRKIDVKNNSFRDEFSGHSRHVYKMKLSPLSHQVK